MGKLCGLRLGKNASLALNNNNPYYVNEATVSSADLLPTRYLRTVEVSLYLISGSQVADDFFPLFRFKSEMNVRMLANLANHNGFLAQRQQSTFQCRYLKKKELPLDS